MNIINIIFTNNLLIYSFSPKLFIFKSKSYFNSIRKIQLTTKQSIYYFVIYIQLYHLKYFIQLYLINKSN